MIVILYIIIGIISLFFATFLEILSLALFNFRILFLLFLLFRKRVDWKPLLFVVTVISLILDVVMHYKLGTNLLLFAIPSGILLLLSFMFSVDDESISKYVAIFLASLGYYISSQLLPSVLVTGSWGVMTIKSLLFIVLRAVIAIVIVWAGELLVYRLRDRGNSKQIRLK